MDREGEGKVFRADPLPTRRHPGPPSDEAADRLWARLGASLPKPPDFWWRDRVDADAALRAWLGADPPPSLEPDAAVRIFGLMIAADYGDGDPWARRHAAFTDRVALFARWLVASSGGVAAVCAADLLRVARDEGRSPRCRSAWHDPFSLGLRAALAAAPPAAFEAARDAALALAGSGDWAGRAFFAFLLADDGPGPHPLRPEPVLAEALRQGADPAVEPRLVPLIADMRPSAAAAWRGQRRGLLALGSVQLDPARLAATVAAVAARHGEPALPTLFWLFRQAEGDDREVWARAMLETREDEAVARLLPDLDRKAVRAALNRAASAYPAWTLGRCLALVVAGRGGPTMEHRLREMIARHGIEAARRWCIGAEARAVLDGLAALPAAALAAPDAVPAFLREAP